MKRIKDKVNEIVIKEFNDGDVLVLTSYGFKYYKY